jgi:hypothetical protein
MAFRSAARATANEPKRVALYLRVSTGRQAAGDVSIPSQRDLDPTLLRGAGLDGGR